MVEILLQENNNLKHELESCYQKVAKSQKVPIYKISFERIEKF